MNCGLPLRPRTDPKLGPFPFYPVEAVAAREESSTETYIMAGGKEKGVYLSKNRGDNYEPAAHKGTGTVLRLYLPIDMTDWISDEESK